MPSNAPQNDADVSAVDDQLATLEIPEGQAKIRSTDSSEDGDGTARPTEDSDQVLDPELWKPHPPTEDCPVCFVPLPLSENKSTSWVCCGKLICNGCAAENMRAERVINAKRAKKKLPPLDHACPFCRSTLKTTKSQFEELIRKGDGRTAYNLAFKYRNGDARSNIPKDEAKALELIHHAADDLGFPVAIKELGHMYYDGVNGIPKDKVKGRKYLEDGTKMNNVPARSILGDIEAQDDNIDLAIRHWKLAAGAGCEFSVKMLWKFFYNGALEKAELEKTLRAHKEACDSMNSVERGRYALWKKAEADNDVLLEKILISYYNGEIKAKELNKLLKAHQNGILSLVPE